MNPIDVLTAEQVNVKLNSDHLVLTLDKQDIVLNYEAISHIEALLIRLAFAQEKTVVYPGAETPKLLAKAMLDASKTTNPETPSA